MKITTFNLEERVRNYEGNNEFVKSVQSWILSGRGMSQAQRDKVRPIILNDERKKDINVDELSNEFKSIVTYDGNNKFINNIKDSVIRFRELTQNQITSANKAIVSEKSKNSKVDLNLKLVGNTIKLGRLIAEDIKEAKKINFFPILVDVTEVLTMTDKAFRLKAKLTKENGGICRCCGKTLTDEMSRMTGIGPVCSKYVGVEHPSTKADLPKYREEINQKIDEIGEFEFWIPKSKIKEWKGSAGVMLKF